MGAFWGDVYVGTDAEKISTVRLTVYDDVRAVFDGLSLAGHRNGTVCGQHGEVCAADFRYGYLTCAVLHCQKIGIVVFSLVADEAHGTIVGADL